jgi:hypothetical protein
LNLHRERDLTECFDPPTVLLVSNMTERPFARPCMTEWFNVRDFRHNFSIAIKYVSIPPIDDRIHANGTFNFFMEDVEGDYHCEWVANCEGVAKE